MGEVLLVSHGEKNREIFTELLMERGLTDIQTARSSAQARKLMADAEFKLVIVVTPLPEEYGCEIAKSAARTTAGVMMVVKGEHEKEMTEKMEPEGVVVFSPGMGKKTFRCAVSMLLALHFRLDKAAPRQAQLERKIEDIRLVDRAKCLLIQYEAITEEQAHHYIEKEAMNRRITRREMAETILKSYDV